MNTKTILFLLVLVIVAATVVNAGNFGETFAYEGRIFRLTFVIAMLKYLSGDEKEQGKEERERRWRNKKRIKGRGHGGTREGRRKENM
ncbi:putative panusin-like 1 [Homarus americanus]|uniref:Putative panusin-like 1 n=1 Tax=Homarus americanus TaxID=6706 RepID=A0A8J5KDA2_HOMAM|nr:putative panusin-like 1 [Homarus americanus]